MTETIIRNHNSVVGSNDTVYLLGDIGFYKGTPTEVQAWTEELLDSLNGNIHWLRGNHDKDSMWAARGAKKYEGILEIKVGKIQVVMCHYAMRVWNRSHHGSYHLFGHSHGQLKDDPHALSMDVGIDCNNLYPFSWDLVCSVMSRKPWKPFNGFVDFKEWSK